MKLDYKQDIQIGEAAYFTFGVKWPLHLLNYQLQYLYVLYMHLKDAICTASWGEMECQRHESPRKRFWKIDKALSLPMS
jgi:hypothetical protein